MNIKQQNKLGSYHATLAALESIPEADSIPGLSGELEVFRAKMGEIMRLAQLQQEAMAGKRARRDQLLNEMAEAAVDVAKLVAAYADKQQLTELAPLVRVDLGDFARARKVAGPVLAKTVLDAAQSVLPELAPVGVTAEMLEDLAQRIETAVEGIHQPRTGVVERKSATNRITALLGEIDALLESQIDRLVHKVRKTHPQAYASYRSAREVVDRLAGVGPREEANATPLVSGPSEKQAA